MSGADTQRTVVAQARYQQEQASGQRTCPRCSVIKPLEEFPLKGLYRDGVRTRYAYCKECHAVYQRAHNHKRKYGLEAGEYDKLLAGQNGVCYICKRPPRTVRLSVDHDHKTGLTRGLLCMRCNRLLGWVRDDAAVLESAAEYLKDPPAESILGRVVQGLKGSTQARRRRRTRPAKLKTSSSASEESIEPISNERNTKQTATKRRTKSVTSKITKQ